MLYKGIELDISKEAHFTKSVSLSYIGQDVSYNVKYSELLSDIECRKLSPESYYNFVRKAHSFRCGMDSTLS